jgi:death-on-curing protein
LRSPARSSGSRWTSFSASPTSDSQTRPCRAHRQASREEFYATIEAKAATLLFGVARNHPFIDGNKRVAVLAALQFLNVNGLDLNLSPPEEAYKVIAGVAAGTVTLEVLTAWIAARLEPLPDE